MGCQNYVQSTLYTSVYSNRKWPDLAFWLRGPEVEPWCRAERSRLTARQTQVPPITSLIAALVCSDYWNWASLEISVAPVILLSKCENLIHLRVMEKPHAHVLAGLLRFWEWRSEAETFSGLHGGPGRRRSGTAGLNKDSLMFTKCTVCLRSCLSLPFCSPASLPLCPCLPVCVGFLCLSLFCLYSPLCLCSVMAEAVIFILPTF